MMEPESQVAGAIVIFDMDGLSLQQVWQFTPPFAKRIVDWLQVITKSVVSPRRGINFLQFLCFVQFRLFSLFSFGNCFRTPGRKKKKKEKLNCSSRLTRADS